MQTFLPYANFKASAKVLDQKRLGKQRVETLQIMQALLGIKLGNLQKQVESAARIFYYVMDEDGYEFEINESDLDDYSDVRRVMEPTRNLVDTTPDEWTILPLDKPGWFNHPATKMWVGYEWALLQYQRAICDEWRRRGFKDTCFRKTFHLYFADLSREGDNQMPNWLGDRKFHRSHKSNLIRKDHTHYAPIFWGVRDNLPYVWPVSDRLV